MLPLDCWESKAWDFRVAEHTIDLEIEQGGTYDWALAGDDGEVSASFVGRFIDGTSKEFFASTPRLLLTRGGHCS